MSLPIVILVFGIVLLIAAGFLVVRRRKSDMDRLYADSPQRRGEAKNPHITSPV